MATQIKEMFEYFRNLGSLCWFILLSAKIVSREAIGNNSVKMMSGINKELVAVSIM